MKWKTKKDLKFAEEVGIFLLPFIEGMMRSFAKKHNYVLREEDLSFDKVFCLESARDNKKLSVPIAPVIINILAKGVFWEVAEFDYDLLNPNLEIKSATKLAKSPPCLVLNVKYTKDKAKTIFLVHSRVWVIAIRAKTSEEFEKEAKKLSKTDNMRVRM